MRWMYNLTSTTTTTTTTTFWKPLRRHVTEEDFDVGGPLHHAQMELLLWASYRGQLLARTVRGERRCLCL